MRGRTRLWLLSRRLCSNLLPGGTAVGSLGCPLLYFLALLCPSYKVGLGCLTTQERYLRILHIQEDQLCPWAPSMDVLRGITSLNPGGAHPPPLFTLHYIAKGRVGWLDRDTHCYAHLLRVAISPTPALLAVYANLEDLCAYSVSFLPLSALEEQTAYLLLWAASCSPFPLLTPEKLRSAGDSNIGALHAAETVLGTRVALQDVKEQLLAGLGRSLVTSGDDSPGARLVASVFRQLLQQMPGDSWLFSWVGCCQCYIPQRCQAAPFFPPWLENNKVGSEEYAIRPTTLQSCIPWLLAYVTPLSTVVPTQLIPVGYESSSSTLSRPLSTLHTFTPKRRLLPAVARTPTRAFQGVHSLSCLLASILRSRVRSKNS